MNLKANTAVDVLIGPFVDSTDGNTAETGLTISQADVRLSKNGQNMAQKNDTTACVHDELGYYNCELDATDLNTEGNLVLIVHETGALPVRHEFNVLSEAAWDSLYVAKDTGFMDVNVKAVSEDETAADNLETACDNYSATRGLAGTSLPDAAADDAGGLPISDAGGLDLDTQIGTDIDAILTDTADMQPRVTAIETDTNELQLDDVPGLISALDTVVDTIKDETALIVADTNELQTNQGNWATVTGHATETKQDIIDTVVDDIQTDLSNGADGLGALKALIDGLNDISTTQVNAEVDTALSDYDPPTNTEMVAAFTEIKGATFAATDTLEAIRDRGDAAWVTGSGGDATEAKQDTIISNLATVDGIVDNILVDTSTTLENRLIAIEADTNELQTDDVPGLISTLDAVVDTVKVDTAAILIDTADMQPRVAAIEVDTGTTLQAELDGIQADTEDIQTQIGTAGDGLSGIPAVTLANGAHGGAGASITLSSYSDFTGAAAANPNVLQDGTITVTTQTSFTLSTGSADDDAYNNMVIVFEDVATATQKSVRTITDYVGASKTVIIDSAPDFTIVTTDNFSILAVAPGSTPPTVEQIRTEMDDNSTQLAAIVLDTGTTLENRLIAIEADTNELQTDDIPAAITALDAVVDTVKTDTAAILIDTNELQEDLTNGGRVDLILDELTAQGDTNEGKIDAIDTVVDGIQTDLSNGTDGLGALKTLIDTVQLDLDNGTDGLGALKIIIDTIKDRTDNLPDDPSDQSDVEAVIISAHETTDGLVTALNDITVGDIIAGITEESSVGTYDLQEMLRIMFAILAGHGTGGGTSTVTYKDSENVKSRIVATVDVNGNRTPVSYDGT